MNLNLPMVIRLDVQGLVDKTNYTLKQIRIALNFYTLDLKSEI